jgi:hypothetical protein
MVVPMPLFRPERDKTIEVKTGYRVITRGSLKTGITKEIHVRLWPLNKYVRIWYV